MSRVRLLDPVALRAYLGDGNFGGRYQRADDEMLALWRVAVDETRALLTGSWVLGRLRHVGEVDALPHLGFRRDRRHAGGSPRQGRARRDNGGRRRRSRRRHQSRWPAGDGADRRVCGARGRFHSPDAQRLVGHDRARHESPPHRWCDRGRSFAHLTAQGCVVSARTASTRSPSRTPWAPRGRSARLSTSAPTISNRA